MSTWDDVHAGAIVLGHDGLSYGVEEISHDSPYGPVIVLTRHGVRVGPAQPPPGTPITILENPAMPAEAAAFAVLAEAGLGPQLIRESYHP